MEFVKFLGLYSGKLNLASEKQPRIPTDRQYWYIWFNQKEKNYIAQALNKLNMPTGVPYTISALMFGLNFIEENNIEYQQQEPPNMFTLKKYEQETTQINIKKYKEIHLQDDRKGRQNLSSNNTNQSVKAPTEKAKNSAQTKNLITENPIVASEETTQITHVQNTYTLPKPNELNTESENPEEEKLLLPKNAFDDKIENIRAKRIDINFRSDFASGMLLWEKGKKGAAAVRFNNLLKRNESFIKAHKHMFTDCAIQLRKIHQNELALTFAMRCTDLSPDDSHTYFNVGRLYYELREYRPSGSYLEKALELEPDLAPALRLYEIVQNILARVAKTHEE